MSTKTKGKPKENRIHVVDVSNWINRAYFAAPPLTTSNGIPTGALKAFTEMVHRLLLDNDGDNDYFIFPFDCPRKQSWRYRYSLSEGLTTYKGNRDVGDQQDSERKANLTPQFKYAKRILEAMGYKCPVSKSFEADDLIGTVAKRFGVKGNHVYIYSRDKDFIQCVNQHVTLVQPQQANSPERIFRPDNCHERYVDPELMVEFLMMVGDSSDSVAGVKGIGDKTAIKLLNQYGSIKEARAKSNNKALAAVTDKYLDQMRDLITIIDNTPYIPKTLQGMKRTRPRETLLSAMKVELEFRKLFYL